MEPLEKLYAVLAQCIYRHRNDYNKTELIQVQQPTLRQKKSNCDNKREQKQFEKFTHASQSQAAASGTTTATVKVLK